MKVLHLTLKKIWFDKTYSGEKPEEYREIKPYWIKRLVDKDLFKENTVEAFYEWLSNPPHGVTLNHIINTFDVVYAKNGYSKRCPEWKRKWLGLRVGYGKPEWGAKEDEMYFIISLGDKV